MKSRLALIVACCLAITACHSMRMPNLWPFHKKAKPAPEAVNEFALVNADGTPANFPQYWKRNALVIDLSGVGGAGSVTARLPEGTPWPVRVAVRVRPGSVGQVEIQGEERDVITVTSAGTSTVDLELAPSVYTPKTAAIYISWGPVATFAEPAAAESKAPEFVSPTVVPKAVSEPAEPVVETPPAVETPASATPPKQ